MNEERKRVIKVFGKEIVLSKKLLIIASAVLLAVVAAVVFIVIGTNNKLKATTMRLLKMEGTVTLEENGVAKTVKENLRFKSGDALSTDVASMVAVGLDDTKVITLDEESRAEFEKSGKHLKLALTKGRLFFNVTEKLEADASFTITTSNTTVGIRGTSGVVCFDENGNPAIYLTDGEIEAEAYNPVTGETKTIKVKAPAKLEVHYYNDRPEGKTVEFTAVPLEPDMLPDFATEVIYNDQALMDKIAAYTGWEIKDIKDAYEKKGEEVTPTPTPTSTPTPTPTPPPSNEDTEEGETGDPVVETPQVDETQVVEPINYAELAKNDPGILAAIDHIGEDGLIYLTDGTIFDWQYYAQMYPEVAAAYGYDPYALLYHYLNIGQYEDRFVNKEEEHQAAVKKQEEEQAAKKFQEEQEAAARAAEEAENQQSSSSSEQVVTHTCSIVCSDYNPPTLFRTETHSVGEQVTISVPGSFQGVDGVTGYQTSGNFTVIFTMPDNDVTIRYSNSY